MIIKTFYALQFPDGTYVGVDRKYAGVLLFTKTRNGDDIHFWMNELEARNVLLNTPELRVCTIRKGTINVE